MSYCREQPEKVTKRRYSAVFEFFSRTVVKPIHGLLGMDLCLVCNSELGMGYKHLCAKCWSDLRENLQPDACPVCGHNVGLYALIDGRCHRCQHKRPKISNIVRVGQYNGPLRKLILDFKFRKRPNLDVLLGDLLASAILGNRQVREADYFVPIPLHWRRRWNRTYNQSELLAQVVVCKLKKNDMLTSINTDLRRIRYTKPQALLATSQRTVNLRRAFAVYSETKCRGKHVCLIDDVTTTGTTLRVAAGVLKRAGAAKVSAAVVAVAAND